LFTVIKLVNQVGLPFSLEQRREKW